jgi:hypothetical protein
MSTESTVTPFRPKAQRSLAEVPLSRDPYHPEPLPPSVRRVQWELAQHAGVIATVLGTCDALQRGVSTFSTTNSTVLEASRLRAKAEVVIISLDYTLEKAARSEAIQRVCDRLLEAWDGRDEDFPRGLIEIAMSDFDDEKEVCLQRAFRNKVRA